MIRGSFDTVVLSLLVITYFGPICEPEVDLSDALQAVTYIALLEVVTKMVLYFLHEQG